MGQSTSFLQEAVEGARGHGPAGEEPGALTAGEGLAVDAMAEAVSRLPKLRVLELTFFPARVVAAVQSVLVDAQGALHTPCGVSSTCL